MIVSHAHRFIFWIPECVAGSSLVMALGKHCREGDHVSWPGDLEGHPDYSRPVYPLGPHAGPAEIRACVGDEAWHRYEKVTVIRNPWDQVVGLYHRRRKSQLSPNPLRLVRALLWGDAVRGFSWFARRHPNENAFHYFDADGGLVPDTVLRFERLGTEYAELCGRLGLPHEPPPSPKGRFRRQARRRKHYTQYYTPRTRHAVAEKYAREIERFDYRFGDDTP